MEEMFDVPENLRRQSVVFLVRIGRGDGRFAAYGSVQSCALPTDRDTGRPRGFGFVEMDQADAAKAIQALNGQDFQGRTLTVNEARPRGDRGGDRGGGNRGGGSRW